MLLSISMSSQFKEDLKKVKKQNKDLSQLKEVINLIANNTELDIKYRNHKLLGSYVNNLELHIQPDWLLIYQIVENELYLVRTGSHAELF